MQLGRKLRGIALAALAFTAPQAMAAEYSGIWLDSEKNGQGVNFHHEGDLVSGAWYFYDDGGQATWLTFVGTLNGNSLSADLLEFTGPPFGGEAWEDELLQSAKAGTVSIFFQSASTASFFYTLEGTDGTLNLTRFGAKTQHLDGIYRGMTSTSSASAGEAACETTTLGFAVVDHKLEGHALSSGGSFYQLTGAVDNQGTITGGGLHDGETQFANFNGIVNGDSGGGTWNDLDGCSGTWNASVQ
jgi:hypothetical protein